MGSALDSVFGSTGEGGKNAGNLFAQGGGVKNTLGSDAWMNQVNQGAAVNQANTVGNATNEVQNNGILGQIYGQGGLFGNTINQANDLSQNGFKLTDTDRTAYGQASGDIARMFGQNEQSLSQALSNRGLSSSGAAGQAFSNSLGNKNEQLSQIQNQIAQQRMQMNQQRLAQTQNFIGQLGSQAQGAIGQQLGAENQRGQNMYNMGMGYLGAQQGQANSNLEQYQQTNHGTGLGQLGAAAIQGGAAALSGGMSGAAGNPMAGAQKSPTMAGQSSMFGGSVA